MSGECHTYGIQIILDLLNGFSTIQEIITISNSHAFI